jgi:hypothetical protein
MSDFIPIHNAFGQVELWLYEDRLLALNGQSVGFIHEEHVYDYNGIHRGRLMSGVLRDHAGAVVGFTPSATGLMPIRPFLHLRPLAPLRSLEPLRPLRSFTPFRPFDQISWSQMSPLALFDL